MNIDLWLFFGDVLITGVQALSLLLTMLSSENGARLCCLSPVRRLY